MVEVRVEDDDVARLQLVLADLRERRRLRAGVVGHAHSRLVPRGHGEAGAVEGRRTGGVERVRLADLRPCERDGNRAARGRGWAAFGCAGRRGGRRRRRGCLRSRAWAPGCVTGAAPVRAVEPDAELATSIARGVPTGPAPSPAGPGRAAAAAAASAMSLRRDAAAASAWARSRSRAAVADCSCTVSRSSVRLSSASSARSGFAAAETYWVRRAKSLTLLVARTAVTPSPPRLRRGRRSGPARAPARRRPGSSSRQAAARSGGARPRRGRGGAGPGCTARSGPRGPGSPTPRSSPGSAPAGAARPKPRAADAVRTATARRARAVREATPFCRRVAPLS